MHNRDWTLIKSIAVGIVLALFAALSIAMVEARRSVDRTMHCATAFKLRHAFQTYLTLNGSFPPRILGVPESKTQASWRMLLQIAEDVGEPKYRLHESWESNHNIKYADEHRLVVYHSDPAEGPPVPTTTFVAVSDLESILRDGPAVRPAEVTEGLENTLLVAQVPHSDIPWPEPRDLTFEELCRACDAQFDSQDESATAGYLGQLLLFADGEIFRVSRPLPLSDFKTLWTRSAGDGPDRESLVLSGHLQPQNDRQFQFDKN